MSAYSVSTKAKCFYFLNRKNNLKTRAQEKKKKKAKRGRQQGTPKQTGVHWGNGDTAFLALKHLMSTL